MSAPHTDLPSSISSTGHEDGLGRRSLSFDRESGAMLEHLFVRPELAVYERLIRERIDQLAAFDDDRFARPSSVGRAADTGELAVISAFVPGHRVSDLLEISHESGVVPGVDVALGYLLDALPALSALHATAGFTHGLIDPARSVLTSAGRVVFVDVVFGAAVHRLGLSSKRLWTMFGIAAPSATANALDAALDVSQIALSAVMLVLGRRLREEEYPEAIPSLLMEVVDVAQIRGSTGFAGGLQRILQRSLPLPGRRGYTTADEMVVDVRQLVRREIGVEVCRRALRDFVEQMDSNIAASAAAEDEQEFSDTADEQDLTESILDESDSDENDSGVSPIAAESDSPSDPFEFEIRLEGDDTEAVYDLPSLHFGDGVSGSAAALESRPIDEPLPEPARTEPYQKCDNVEGVIEGPVATGGGTRDPLPDHATSEPETSVRYDPEPSYRNSGHFESSALTPEPELRGSDAFEPTAESIARSVDLESPTHLPPEPPSIHVELVTRAAASAYVEPEAIEPDPVHERPVQPEFESAPIEAEPIGEPSSDASAESSEDGAADSFAEPDHEEPVGAASVETESEQKTEEAADRDSKHSRRKRHQQKSARARKDKLRSTAVLQPTVSQPTASEPAAAAKPQPSKSGWLVPPDRAAAFEQHAAAPPPLQPAPMMMPPPPAASIPQPSFAPAPVAVYTPPPAVPQQPVHQAPPMPVHQTSRHTNMPPGRSAVTIAPVASSPVVKLKADPPSGYEPPKTRRAPQPPSGVPLEPVSTLPTAMRGPMFATEEPRGFPWKLAIAVLAVVAIGIVGGRAYLATHSAQDPTAGTTASPVPIAPELAPPVTPVPKNSGQIVVQTQPSGAKVLLDGKAAGESPITLTVAPGRHVVTLISSSGSVKQSVRVAAGKSVTIDQPVFSGWLAVFAPIVLDVSEGGKPIGSTEQNRLLLAPGHHSVTISNKELGYTAVQEVDINGGEVTSITINPVGTVNFNAVPWAEVWSEGKKIGETPIANMNFPLGAREFVFKNTQLGERRVTATIRGDQPTLVSVDFAKPPER